MASPERSWLLPWVRGQAMVGILVSEPQGGLGKQGKRILAH